LGPRDQRARRLRQRYGVGDAFEIAVENNANALDVFHHPYAYAPEPIAAAAASSHGTVRRPV
jgi:hypothetical protein